MPLIGHVNCAAGTSAISTVPDDLDQVASRTYGDTKSSENIGSPDTESDFHGQSKQKTENGLADIKPLDLEHINDKGSRVSPRKWCGKWKW